MDTARIIESMANGQWKQACEYVTHGARSKPDLLAARTLRLAIALQGETNGELLMLRLSNALENAAVAS